MSGYTEITVDLQDGKFGWGWSCTPTGEDAYSIEVPKGPDHVGTVASVRRKAQNDRAFNSLGGAFYNTAWFYDGKRITHTWNFDCIADRNDPNDPDYDWDKREYGYTWVPGFEIGQAEKGRVKIRVEQ